MSGSKRGKPILSYPIDRVLQTDRQTDRRARIPLSFHIYPEETVTLRTGQKIPFLEAFDQLRHVDNWDQSRLIKEALTEYIFNHHPGNPGLPLDHWTKDMPFSKAAEEKLAPPPPATPNYSTMTIQELEDCLKKRFLPDFDRTAITFLLKKKAEAHLK